jgi:hypothetical protein
MGSGTGRQAEQARLQIGEKRQHLSPLELFPQRDLVVCVHAVYLKNVFCNA